MSQWVITAAPAISYRDRYSPDSCRPGAWVPRLGWANCGHYACVCRSLGGEPRDALAHAGNSVASGLGMLVVGWLASNGRM